MEHVITSPPSEHRSATPLQPDRPMPYGHSTEHSSAPPSVIMPCPPCAEDIQSCRSPPLSLSPKGFHQGGGISGLCPRRAREESDRDIGACPQHDSISHVARVERHKTACHDLLGRDHALGAQASESGSLSRIPSTPTTGQSEASVAPPLAADTVTVNDISSQDMFHLFMDEKIDFQVALHLFAGPPDRQDGYAAMLRAQRVPCLEIDLLVDARANLRCDVVYKKLCELAKRGLIFFALIGVPCKTWSVARVNATVYPFQTRTRGAVHGVPNLTRAQRLQLVDADELGRRAFALGLILDDLRRVAVFETPVDRGDDQLPWYQPQYASHVYLFAAEYAVEYARRVQLELIHFCQCACGSEFQKRTSLLASARIKHLLGELERAQCSHPRHQSIAFGFDDAGKAISAKAAAYPAGMNAMLAGITVAWLRELATHEGWASCLPGVHALSAAQPLEGLYSGSTKPHAPWAEAAAHVGTPSAKIGTASLRRLEPEVTSVLRLERLPAVNIMPETSALPSPREPRVVPPPLTTSQLIPVAMQERLREHRVAVAACFDRAQRNNGWRWARDHRPPPLIATEREALLPAGRGWKWGYDTEQKLWYAITPSRWPDDPPNTELNISNLMEWASEAKPSDQAIVSEMAHGYSGPSLAPVVAIGSLHVGALKEMKHFLACTEKDRRAGIGVWGRKLPPIWPCRVDYRNVVMRRNKPRVTIDKTMRLAPWLQSHNDAIDLDASPELEYVNVAQLGRARAILRTSGAKVVPLGFDLSSYFRRTGKNRSAWWMAGTIDRDGYGFDPRVQFGDRAAPVQCGRQTCLLADAIKRELRRLDLTYPSKVATVNAYVAERTTKLRPGASEIDFTVAALSFILAFVDDIAGMVIDDELFDGDRPLLISHTSGGGEREWRQQRRGELYLEAALGVIRFFGHSEAAGKTWHPAQHGHMPFLGISIDCERERLLITGEKQGWYVEDIMAMLDEDEGKLDEEGGARVKADELNSVLHKLLHAATCVALGRQHLYQVMRCLRASGKAGNGAAVIGVAAKAELRWWLAQLRKEDSEGVPMASRRSFPEPGPGTLAPYFDASRELKSPQSSGFGAWAVINGEFCYIEGRWSHWELRDLSINVLELAARNLGTFTFLDHARNVGVDVTHLFEFTDNRAAELTAEFGKPHTPRMQALIKAAYVELRSLEVYNSMLRITSEDNDIADGLSRGGEKLADALRIASATGIQVKRLAPLEKWRDLTALRGLS